MNYISQKSLFVFMLCTIGFLFNLDASAAKGASMFSVLSWNILGPNTQDSGGFFTKGDYSRLDPIIKRIKTEIAGNFGPSILCLQEIDLKTLQTMDTQFQAGNKYKRVAYQEKGGNGGAVLYVKSNDFDVIDSQGVDLGDGGSAAIGILKSKKTGALFAVSSLHLSRGSFAIFQAHGERQLARLKSVINALEIKNGLNSAEVHKVYAGDYNTDKSEVASSTLDFLKNAQEEKYSDAFPQVDTVNDKYGNRKGIDHIVTSAGLEKVDQYSKVVGNEKNKKIHEQIESDHAALYAVYYDRKTGAETIKKESLPISQDIAVNTPAVRSSTKSDRLPANVQDLLNDLYEEERKGRSAFTTEDFLKNADEKYKPLLDYAEKNPDLLKNQVVEKLKNVLRNQDQRKMSVVESLARDLKKDISSGGSLSEQANYVGESSTSADELEQKYKPLLDYAQDNPEWIKSQGLKQTINNLIYIINTKKSDEKEYREKENEVINQVTQKDFSELDLHNYLNQENNVSYKFNNIKNYQIVLDYAQNNPTWAEKYGNIIQQAKIEKIIADIPITTIRGAGLSFKNYCREHYQVILDYAQKYPNLFDEDVKGGRNRLALDIAREEHENYLLAYSNPEMILKKARENGTRWARENESLVEYALYRDKTMKNYNWNKTEEQKDLKDYRFADGDEIFRPYKVLDAAHENKNFVLMHSAKVQAAKSGIVEQAAIQRRYALQRQTQENQTLDSIKRLSDDKELYGR